MVMITETYWRVHSKENGYLLAKHLMAASILPNQTSNGVTFMKRDGVIYLTGEKVGNITTWNAYKGTRPRNIALLACIKY